MSKSRYYQTNGKDYDAFIQCVPHHEQFQNLIAETLRMHVEPTANKRILEIGCGTGLTTEKLVEAMPDAKIHAVDSDANMIAEARERLSNSNVNFDHVDIFQIMHEFREECFDGIVSGYCFHNMLPIHRLELFSGFKRILKKGGIIVTGDKIARDNPLEHWDDLKEAIERFSKMCEMGRSDLKELWTSHYLYDDSIRLTEKEQRFLFQLAWCDDAVFIQRWGIDVVARAIRANA